jgi:glycosyltransferase involved in cell wall biosynthesis
LSAAAERQFRIGFVYGDYPPNLPGRGDGGSDFLRHLAETLVGRGHEVTAIVSRRDDRAGSYVADEVCVEPVIDDWTLQGARRQGAMLRRLMDRRSFDVVHLIYPDPYLRYRTDSYHLPFVLKSIARRPLVTTLFGFAVTQAHLVTRAGLLSLFASSDRIVITDSRLLGQFRRWFPWWSGKARAGLVGSIARDGEWEQSRLGERKAALGLDPERRYVGFFGFWTPDKGLENLLDAIDMLRRGHPEVSLVLIGGGDRTPEQRNDYERAIARRVDGQAVIDTGPLSEDRVTEHMLAMDVCALPFKVNPLGRSSLALALGLGVPTVVTRPPQDVRLLEGCVLLDSSEPGAIASAIGSLLGDAGAQQKAAAAARAAARHWSWASIADGYIDLYREIARTGRG